MVNINLESAIKSKKIFEIRRIVKETPIADLADIIEKLPSRYLVIFFRVIGISQSSKIFSFLEPEFQEIVISNFTDQEQQEALSIIYADDIADLIEEVPSNISKRIIKNTPKEKRENVNKLLRYKDNQTGSIMSVDMIELKQTSTAKKALNLIKKEFKNVESTTRYYVVNQKGKLVGFVRLQDLVFASSDKKIKEFMLPAASIVTTMDKEDAALEFSKHDVPTLPVVNSKGYLMGMITSDDVIDTITSEATEDIHKMAGIDYIEDSYLKTTVVKIFKSRVIWILLIMLSSTFSQIILDIFINISLKSLNQSSVAITTSGITSALMAIVPVISGAAGNAGSQASTMVTRSIALGEIGKGSTLKVLKKEMGIGFCVGLVLSVVNFIRLILYYSIKGETFSGKSLEYIWISLTASISLFLVIFIAKTIGGLLPLIAKRFNLDPAVMAAPLLTTLIDALSILIFFSISIGILLLVL